MLRIDCGHDRHGFHLRHVRSGERIECGNADRGLPGGERETARCRDADPKPCETARANRRHDPLEGIEVETRVVHHALDERDQYLGVAAAHRE